MNDSKPLDSQSSFPVHVLPPPLEAYVQAAAASLQASVDLAAVTCLGVCSAAMAGRFRIAAQAGDEQPASLFVATVTQGLCREADLFQQAKRPLQTLEAEKIEAGRIPRIQAQSLHRQAKIRLRQREKQAAGDQQQFRGAALDFATQIVENPVPALPRLLMDDTTTEKLSTILAEQNGRIARFSTEVAARDLFSGNTSQRSLAQQALYWQGYRGEDLTLDQRGGERVFVRRPAITCVCAVPLATVAGLRQGRARRSRGVLDPFLFALPESEVNKRQGAPKPVAEEVRQRYEALIRSLAAWNKDVTLTLTSEALQRFQAWEAEVAALHAAGGLLESCPAWADYLPGNTLRIAAILHAVGSNTDDQVTAATLEAAITIARYFIPHAIAMFQLLHQRCESGGDAPQVQANHLPPATSPTTTGPAERSETERPAANQPAARSLPQPDPQAHLRENQRDPPQPGIPSASNDLASPIPKTPSHPQAENRPPTQRGHGPRRYRGTPAAKQRAKR